MSTNNVPPSYVEPSQLYSGYQWYWNKSFSYYPANQWTLSYRIVGANGAFTITATQYNGGTDFSVVVPASTTATYNAGQYTWVSSVTDGTQIFQLGNGELTILTNPLVETSGDTRSVVKQTLDAINNLIMYRATGVGANGQPMPSLDTFDYTIGGQISRQHRFTTLADLMKIRDRYQVLYNQELWAQMAANGMDTPDNVRVNFQTPNTYNPFYGIAPPNQ